MSSCFLCDTSCNLDADDKYYVYYSDDQREYHLMKYKPIMVGSSGFGFNNAEVTNKYGDDQQHNNNHKQNYISYRVKKIEFRASISEVGYSLYETSHIPVYIILFKVPIKEIIFEYYFERMDKFILYSNPECVLSYGVYNTNNTFKEEFSKHRYGHVEYNLNVNKPFIVGPNDYVGVLYFFSTFARITSSAKVWFDVV